MNNDENLQVLREVHKGTQMGLDAITYVSKKVGDPKFKNELSSQYNQYDDILNRINDSYTNLGQVPNQGTTKDKMFSWMGIQMNTMMDQSNSKISELLIQGTTMGIIEGRRILNHNPNVNENVRNILNDFVKMQENSIEKLKAYL